MRRTDIALRLAAAAALAATLSACTTTESHGPDFGASVRHNMMMHVINPTPVYGQGVPATSGPRAAGALDRYQKGKTIDLKVESTTKKAE
jgi:type IV pilus biogenesis protein CpaD/CtpE